MAVSPAFSICQCEFSSPLRFIPRKKARPLFSNLQDGSEQPSSEPAAIELEFLGPDGKGDVLKTSVKSGEKVLRNVMRENKLELYGLYGKLMNCGGGGSCGTCIVEILEGQELLSQPTSAEKKHLKQKPGTWRLACQTIVGDKSNAGKVVVQRLPQKKK
ncbi:photosynthetic NDH subunit of subcomplex B 3, chloroplastic isoform X3 [Selaginella moellendorffii]|uniref:photosynthetic NDH subunit of subcomplex B 3, chloroplastic isoform X3 n=1 Tax=Selaginella moellendorffii TaxID=88036 RepID=UPI000D1C2D4C|nr:photosynthetic NDH subunit of subcomplex B 3, chloroplastic isoform X3 [Selaginella moellendorffii]|eukprot:XP_024533966.1 photosynthetic NDH subunit of subcomplex B 3, chloroplastic isoform X3 [Selaginella moellendorffii]